jgi:ankyrin repeat protein
MAKPSKKSVVISVRLDETTLAAVDLLVEAGLAQSRSEAVSQFVKLGVQSSEELLLKAKALSEHIANLKLEMLNAVKSKNLDKVKQLLELDATLKDAKNEQGQTAILMAAYYRANEIKQLLIEKGAELNIYEAATIGSTARVVQLLEQSPELINSHSFDGFTPLGLAAHFGNEETAAYLLQTGADPGLKGTDGKLNNTPLHAAIAGNYIRVVKLLIHGGSDINAQCEGELRRGFTPLHVAAHFNRVEIVKLLLSHGADPNLVNSDGATALDYALSRGNSEIAELIRTAGQ